MEVNIKWWCGGWMLGWQKAKNWLKKDGKNGRTENFEYITTEPIRKIL